MFGIYPLISLIKSTVHEYKLKKYYEKYPEKEKENQEKLAEDFKKLGEAFIEMSEETKKKND